MPGEQGGEMHGLCVCTAEFNFSLLRSGEQCSHHPPPQHRGLFQPSASDSGTLIPFDHPRLSPSAWISSTLATHLWPWKGPAGTAQDKLLLLSVLRVGAVISPPPQHLGR